MQLWREGEVKIIMFFGPSWFFSSKYLHVTTAHLGVACPKALQLLLLVYYKRIQFRDSQMEDMHRARHWGSREIPSPLQMHPPPNSLVCSPVWKLSYISFKSFYRAQSPVPLLLLRMVDEKEGSHPLIKCVVSCCHPEAT